MSGPEVSGELIDLNSSVPDYTASQMIHRLLLVGRLTTIFCVILQYTPYHIIHMQLTAFQY